MTQQNFDEVSTNRDWEYGSWAGTTEGLTARRTIPDGRSSVPTSADFLSAFNPLALPLLPFDRLLEISRDVENEAFPTGIYAINSTFIQYYSSIQVYPYYDANIIENSIMLFEDNVAIKLDFTNDDTPPIDEVPFTDTFLEWD